MTFTQEIEQHNKLMAEKNKIADLERENRLLGERCNQLLKDKGDLTDQIADLKANCDLAIEGRDIKIKELEQKNKELEKRLVSARAEFLRQYKENAELKDDNKVK